MAKAPYKLKLTKLEFLSSCDVPAQGEGGAALLLKRNRDEFTLKAKVSKLDDSLGLVFGYAFAASLDGGKTPHVDSQDDAIDPDFLKTVTEFIEAGGQTDVNHDFAADGKIVYAWPLLPEINAAMGIKSDVVGLAVAVKPSTETFAAFKRGELTGFSIAGSGIREPLEKSARVAKASLYTDEVDGHQHEVCMYEDGSFCVRYATSAGAEREHSHGIVFENGALTILADSGHTHALAEGQPGIAIVPADAIVIVQARANPGDATSKSTRPAASSDAQNTNKEPTMPNEHETKIADLEKQVAHLAKIAKLSGAHKAHLDTLHGDSAEAFLAKSDTDRDALLADVAKRNEDAEKVVYVSKSTGDVYKTKDDARLVEMAKRMDDQAVAIEKADIRKRAAEVLKDMPGTDDAHDLIVRSLLKSGAKPEEITAAFETLNGMRESSTIGKRAPGFTGTEPTDGNPDEALAAFTKGLTTFAKANNIPNVWTDARAAYLKTDEGANLFRAYDATR